MLRIHQMAPVSDRSHLLDRACLLEANLNSEKLKELESLPGLNLPDELITAADGRKLEFLGGRWLAGLAIERLGFGKAMYPGRLDRSPVWPHGVVGSITHTGQVAVVAAARCEDWLSIGIDCEAILTEERLLRIANKILHDSEVEMARSSGALGETGTLIFSAKEAIYKALYPLCHKFFGFHEARILSIDPTQGTLRFRLETSLAQGLDVGFEHGIKFVIDRGRGLVLTLFALDSLPH